VKEVKECPKCGGEVVKGEVRTYGGVFSLRKLKDIVGDRIQAFYCRNCGYIELYKEMKEKG